MYFETERILRQQKTVEVTVLSFYFSCDFKTKNIKI